MLKSNRMNCVCRNRVDGQDAKSLDSKNQVIKPSYNYGIVQIDKEMTKTISTPTSYKPTSQSYNISNNQSKPYTMKRRRLAESTFSLQQGSASFKRNTFHASNLKNINMLYISFILFCCWNSIVMAFHLNEESNSVYPRVKTMSSFFSHKRHSKTVEVFYQNGVSVILNLSREFLTIQFECI